MEIKQKNLENIKKLLGIRNRFWRKKYSELEPFIKDIYQISVLKNYLPFRLAFSKMILKKINDSFINELELKKYYYSKLIKYLTIYGKIYSNNLRNFQYKVVIKKDRVTISVIYPDGSTNSEQRKKILEISDKLFSYKDKMIHEFSLRKISKSLMDEYFITILQPYTSNYHLENSPDIYRDLIESPAGKFMNFLIPGFSSIIEIQKLKKELQTEDIFLISRNLVISKVLSLLQKSILEYVKKFSKIGNALAPIVSSTLIIAMERYTSFQSSYNNLDKNLIKIKNIQNEIEKNKLTQEEKNNAIRNISSQLEYKKLLDF